MPSADIWTSVALVIPNEVLGYRAVKLKGYEGCVGSYVVSSLQDHNVNMHICFHSRKLK